MTHRPRTLINTIRTISKPVKMQIADTIQCVPTVNTAQCAVCQLLVGAILAIARHA